MKKAVFLVVLVVVVLLAVGFWFLKPKPEGLTVESAEKTALSACAADLDDLALLIGAVESDDSRCYKLGSDVMKYYCLAWFGIDLCKNLAEEDQASCTAVFSRDGSGCRDDLCYGILGVEAGCSDPSCSAFARRDLAALKDPALCEPVVARAVRDVECFNTAKSVKELDVCMNQSMG